MSAGSPDGLSRLADGFDGPTHPAVALLFGGEAYQPSTYFDDTWAYIAYREPHSPGADVQSTALGVTRGDVADGRFWNRCG